MSSISQWKLRRLADRAPGVASRHAGAHPTIEEMVPTVTKSAADYSKAYDAYLAYAGTRKKEKKEGRTAVAALLEELDKWLPLGTRDIAGFDATLYGDNPSVPEDVIADADRFLELAAGETDGQGQLLYPWGTKAETALNPLLDKARKEWSEAVDVDSEWQHRSRVTANAADAFDRDLQLLRRGIASILGRNHLDYQRLRASRAAAKDLDGAPGPSATTSGPSPQ